MYIVNEEAYFAWVTLTFQDTAEEIAENTKWACEAFGQRAMLVRRTLSLVAKEFPLKDIPNPSFATDAVYSVLCSLLV